MRAHLVTKVAEVALADPSCNSDAPDCSSQGVGVVRRAEEDVRVLERYAPTVPGFFLYFCFPSVARRSAPLRLFIEAAKALAVRRAS
jgi:hypothetical protein